MRIVALADTHTFEAELPTLPEGDVLIHAGDLCRAGTAEELTPVARWLASLPHPRKVIVPGNHDWLFARDPGQARGIIEAAARGAGRGEITVLIDEGVQIDGVRFWGSPWQPAYNDWAFNLQRGEPLREKWALIPSETDVLITHGPPRGYGDDSLAGLLERDEEDLAFIHRRQGCAALTEALDRVAPRLHVFGHIHPNGGLWWRGEIAIANVTTWEAERGASVFDLDPETGRVTPVEIPPRETER